MEITLRPPLKFDQSIGYWTGEPDLAALSRALARVQGSSEVERITGPDQVLLRGPEAAAREEARLLREAGLL
jgi:hypothetical protein